MKHSPLSWVSWCVFGLVVVAFALHPESPFVTYRLAGPDDFMRAHEVLAFLQGQGWFDLSVPRLSPGAETVLHWSRIVDVPIALVALAFVPFMSMTQAVFVAADLVPLMWLVVLLFVVVRMARPFVGHDRAALASLFILFSPALLFCFTPGRIDHHGVQVLIACSGLWALQAMVLGRVSQVSVALVALAFACGFWIGAEIVPWVALFMAVLGVAAALDKTGGLAKKGALFGAFLPLWTLVLLPLALPWDVLSHSMALSWFSPAYAVFAALAGGVLIAGYALGRFVPTTWVRVVLYGLLGVVAAALFLAVVPSAFHGPFADYAVFNATVGLDHILEAQPLARVLKVDPYNTSTWTVAGLVFMRRLLLPCVAFCVCVFSFVSSRGRLRGAWAVQGVFLAVALGGALFWQARFERFAELFAIIPLTFLLVWGWDRLRQCLTGRPLFWAEIGVFALLAPVPILIVPAIFQQKALVPDLLLFPAARTAPACDLTPVLFVLNDSDNVGKTPRTIMNTGNDGPELLVRTQHRVMAGNFDVPGNEDVFAFFSATEDASAKRIAEKWGVDTVLVCKKSPTLLWGEGYFDPRNLSLQPDGKGMLRFVNTDEKQPLIQRLLQDKAPEWLKPVEISRTSDYLLFFILDVEKP